WWKMPRIDYDKLNELKDKTKKELTNDDIKEMNKMFRDFQTNQWNALFNINKDHRWALMYVRSLNEYFLNSGREPIAKPKVGDIFMMNFLIGYEGEASMLHPGLILETEGGKAFVVPGTTFKEGEKEVYHHNDFPANSKKNY